MKKAALLLILVVAVKLAVAVLAEAQQPAKIPRIGYSVTDWRSQESRAWVEGFRQGLRDFGYIEGKTSLSSIARLRERPIVIEPCGRTGALKVDLLVVLTLRGTLAARQATKTIPIVMGSTQSRLGLSIAWRSGRKYYGSLQFPEDLSGKRLELLTEVVPGDVARRNPWGCELSKHEYWF